MFRCVCLLFMLPLHVIGQVDVLQYTPSQSLLLPTDEPMLGETHDSTIPPTTKGSANVVMEISTTPEPYVPSDATSQPTLDTSDAKEATVQATNTTTAAPTTQATNTTTAAPTTQATNTTNTTTAAPTTQATNTTTAAPTTQATNTTNTTTAAPTTQATNITTAPVPTTPPMPKVGDYVVRAEWNSSACLMARMGLQFSFRMGESFQAVNLDPNPNVTLSSGTCGYNGSDSALMLISDKMTVQFVFTNQGSKFFLSALNLTVVAESGPSFTAGSSNLSLWEASLGSSYMCKKEQSFNITNALTLKTFDLQVQPFGVTNDKFSTAHECSVDDTSLLIPIIVGAALAVLILIVVIAYVIGRRKTYVGYQTL